MALQMWVSDSEDDELVMDEGWKDMPPPHSGHSGFQTSTITNAKRSWKKVWFVLTLLSSRPPWGSCWRENFLPRECVCVVGWGWGVLGCSGGYCAWAEVGVAGVETELWRIVVELKSVIDWGSSFLSSSSLVKNVFFEIDWHFTLKSQHTFF